jgi:hypothetical protein
MIEVRLYGGFGQLQGLALVANGDFPLAWSGADFTGRPKTQPD